MAEFNYRLKVNIKRDVYNYLNLKDIHVQPGETFVTPEEFIILVLEDGRCVYLSGVHIYKVFDTKMNQWRVRPCEVVLEARL